jgi:DNA-binding FadR family transcriptional regulator
MTIKRETLPRRRISDEVSERLEQRIQLGEFGPGDLLPPERDLMDQYGVGRPAVREALFTLRKMGLVEVASGRRARVAQPTPEVLMGELAGAVRHYLANPEHIRHFHRVRALLEIALAREAARNASDEDLVTLRTALDANLAAIGDRDTFIETAMVFHFTLARISHNPIVAAIQDAMITWLQAHQDPALLVTQASYQGHEAIYAAVAARDPDQAEQVMREHLELVVGHYRTGATTPWMNRERAL